MKILVCHNYYQQRGGEDQFFEDEAALLESKGHEVIRHTIHNDSIGERKLLSVALRTLWNFNAARTISSLLKQHQPDVLHVVNTFPLLSPSVFYAARKADVPVVASIQNYRAFCAQAMCFRNGKACEACLGKIPWRAVKYGCYRGSRIGSAVVATMQVLHRCLRTWQRKVDIICVASDFSKSKLKAAGFDEHQMMIKPNFVAVDPGPQVGSGGYALFVGRLAGEKGLDTLLDAWQKHGLKFPLKIVGDGPLGPQVAAAAEESENIQWLGRLPNHEVYQRMGEASCLVFPSIGYESMPKTLIESMAVGTPVLGADVASIGEVVRDGKTGRLFTGGDCDSLAAAVTDFFAADARGESLRKNCREQFEQRFTAELNYLQLIEMYEEAMRRRGKLSAGDQANDPSPEMSLSSR